MLDEAADNGNDFDMMQNNCYLKTEETSPKKKLERKTIAAGNKKDSSLRNSTTNIHFVHNSATATSQMKHPTTVVNTAVGSGGLFRAPPATKIHS